MDKLASPERIRLAAALSLGVLIGALTSVLISGLFSGDSPPAAGTCVEGANTQGIGVPLSDPGDNNRITFELNLEDLNCEGDFFLLVLPERTQVRFDGAVDVTSEKSGDVIGTIFAQKESPFAVVALTDFVETRVGTLSGYIDVEPAV